MRRFVWTLGLAMSVVVLAGAAGCKKDLTVAGADVPSVKAGIEIAGAGLDRPRTFSYEQLARMKTARLENVLMRKSHEEDETTSWEGPALASLLAEAEIKPGPMRLTLEAEDGYEVEASLDDMTDAILALKDGEGRWLVRVDEDCEWKLVPPHKPGNFWIMNLMRVTVEPAGASLASE